MRNWIIALFFGCSLSASAQLAKAYKEGPRVLTFAESSYSRLQIKVKRGSFTLRAFTPDSTFTMVFGPDDVHPLYTFRADLRLNRAACDSIIIESQDTMVMRVQRGSNWTSERPYMGQLTLRPNLIYLEAIARVPIEQYIAGVVEAEGGTSPHQSYHEAQAVLARTWLISNLGKHVEDGYHVKDDQSSQAFKGLAHGKHSGIIRTAVARTRDTIATHAGKPIIGFYHSNSGGQTVLPNEVWSQKLPYCRAVLDPFSKKGSKMLWNKDISLDAWNAYMASLGIDVSVVNWTSFFNTLPQGRQTYWEIQGKSIKLETLRRHFKLRSAYFQPIADGTTIHLRGRGFGHGVGMAQQGAMYMAASGFTWREILDFYFQQLDYQHVDQF